MNDESCKDCVYVSNLRITVDDVKDTVRDIDERLGIVERENEVRKEQAKNTFNTLKEIKEDVKEIKNSGNRFVTGIVSGVTITVIAAFLLQSFKVFHW
jgi:hypothetical protein